MRHGAPIKRTPRKDLALQAISYGNVYVAQIAMGANSEGAAAMLVQAQAAVDEKYRIYEDLAARDGSRFLPHWDGV